MAAGVHFGCVLADAGYGLSAPFRQGLTARRLAWAIGISRHLKVYPVELMPPFAYGSPTDFRGGSRISQQHLQCEEAWLIGEQRTSGAATIKARWICEQAHQQLKGELGLLQKTNP